MKKVYFGKKEDAPALFAVAFDNETEYLQFNVLLKVWYSISTDTNIPELFNDKFYAIGFNCECGADKKECERMYKAIKSQMQAWERAQKIVE